MDTKYYIMSVQVTYVGFHGHIANSVDYPRSISIELHNGIIVSIRGKYRMLLTIDGKNYYVILMGNSLREYLIGIIDGSIELPPDRYQSCIASKYWYHANTKKYTS